MKKSDLNNNIRFSKGNLASKCTGDIIFLTWSLPSRITCPFASKRCMRSCFARKNETFLSVRKSRQRNWDECEKESFVEDVVNHLNYQLGLKSTLGKQIFVRIHTSGDFYSENYLRKWIEIANHFKGNDKILFQAFTKSVQYLDNILKNDSISLSDINIKFSYSIWQDTDKSDIEIAKRLNMQTFTTIEDKDELELKVNEGNYLCKFDCGNCKKCYTEKNQNVVIAKH